MTTARRFLLVLAGLLCTFAHAEPKSLPRPLAGKLNVYFFDVGQGDSALIVSPTGKTVLVDAGPPDSASSLAAKVDALTDGPLDLVVLSHPHLDHLGGLSQLLRQQGAKRYLDPGFDTASSHYKRLLDLVADKEIPYVEPVPGEGGAPFHLGIGGGAGLSVIWPRAPNEAFLSGTRSDANSNSVVFRLGYGRTAFLFTGDAESDTEDKVLASSQRVGATVLKVAHHGSRHSSRSGFLKKVSPKVAVISCALDNAYRHPGEETLERLEDAGAKVVRTDLQGDVHIVSDGEVVTVQTISRAGEVSIVGSFEGAEPASPLVTATAAPTVQPAPAKQKTDAAAAAIALTPADPAPPPSVERAVAQASASSTPARGPQHAGAEVTTDAVNAQPGAAPGPYAASSRSKVFHKSGCRAVKKILAKNLRHYGDREGAARDRRPAGDCHP